MEIYDSFMKSRFWLNGFVYSTFSKTAIGRIGTVNLPKVACLSGWNNFKAANVITGAPLALLSTEVASAYLSIAIWGYALL